MAFDTNTITIKGAELLAAATAQDQLVLDGCDATQIFVTQNDAVVIENRPTTPYSTTSDVSVIGSTDNHVMCRAEFKAGVSTSGDANTLYLFGHKASAPSDIYVIYVASAQTPFYIPDVSDVISAYEALFDLIYAANADAVTTASTSVFTTLAEFNLLKERTVTTHKEGDNAVGDNQTILGEKTFNDPATFADLNVAELKVDTKLEMDPLSLGIISRVVKPDSVSSGTSIGSTYIPYNDGYFSAIHCDSIEEQTSGGKIYVKDELVCEDILNVADRMSNTSGEIKVDQAIIPYDPSTTTNSIGTSSAQWYKAYIADLIFASNNIDSRTAKSNSNIARLSMYRGYTSTNHIGTVLANRTDYSTIQIESDLSTNKGGMLFITEGSTRFEISYDNNRSQYTALFNIPIVVDNGMFGLSPSADISDTSVTVPVGGMITIWLPNTGSGSLVGIEAGRTQLSVSASQYKTAKNSNGTFTAGDRYVPAGTYVALMDILHSGGDAWGIFVRVA